MFLFCYFFMSIWQKIKNLENLSPGLKQLYIHRIIRYSAFGLISLFEVVFIYQLFDDVRAPIVFFLIISGLYAFNLPWFARFLFNRVGLKKLMLLSTLSIGIYLASFFYLSEHGLVWWLVFLALFCSVLNKLMYWVPYHIELAEFFDKHHRGRQLSFFGILVSLVSVILPIFSAWVIAKFGFSVLFLMALVVLVFSVWPLMFIPSPKVDFSFSYWETLKKLLHKKHFKTNLAYFSYGFQDAVGLVVWPIFIFMLLNGNYLEVGGVTAGIMLMTVILKYIMGEATDRFDKKKLIRNGSFLYGLGWVLRALVQNAFHVFFVGVYHNFVSIFMRTPFEALSYEIAADSGHYVDEFTALKEMAFHLGKAALYIVALILLMYTQIVWIFVAGGIVSLFLSLISKEEFIEIHA